MGLPAIDAVVDSARGRRPLRNVTIAARQHLLGTMLDELDAFAALGCRYDRMFFLGKPNSTHLGTISPARKRGIRVHRGSFDGPASAMRSYDAWKSHCSPGGEEVLRAAADQARDLGNTLLIVDNGGLLTLTAQRMGLAHYMGVVAVEQTARGIRWMGGGGLDFPVVAVSSGDKLTFESPSIALSVVREIRERTRAVGLTQRDAFAQPLVVGYGPIGAWVCQALKRMGVKPLVHDSDRQIGFLAELAGFDALTHDDPLADSTLVIDCTGEPIVRGMKGWPFADQCLFANASPENVAFDGLLDGVAGRDGRAVQLPDDDGTLIDWIHRDIRVDRSEKTSWLLNGGFTINLPGTIDSVPASLIQLTRAQMVAAGCQAVGMVGTAGRIVHLDDAWKHLTMDTVAELVPNLFERNRMSQTVSDPIRRLELVEAIFEEHSTGSADIVGIS